jgi:putative transposase
VLYLVATQKRKNRQDMTGKTTGWKTIINTLTVHYGDRIAANTIN